MEKMGTRNGSLRSPGERSEPILVAILVVSKVISRAARCARQVGFLLIYHRLFIIKKQLFVNEYLHQNISNWGFILTEK